MKHNLISIDTIEKTVYYGKDNCTRTCERSEEVCNFVKQVLRSGKFTEDGSGAVNVTRCELDIGETCMFEVVESNNNK